MSSSYQEFVKRAIASGKVYEDLPARIKNAVGPSEWRARWVLAISR